MTTKPHRSAAPKAATGFGSLIRLERRTERLISHRRFAVRMALAVGIWGVMIAIGLAIGMAGYSYFEGMGPADAFMNAAMILSGMGPAEPIKQEGGKIFAGVYAILSGLIIIIAMGFVLAPVFHRILHRFHVEDTEDRD
jgi:hypothetical protein